MYTPWGGSTMTAKGSLFLTNDPAINHRLLNPSFSHQREYLVQVEGSINAEAIEKLTKGLLISVDGKTYKTKPAQAKIPSPLLRIYPKEILPFVFDKISRQAGSVSYSRKVKTGRSGR